ncbi:MAG: type IV pilus twitching motility protein PilT [Phycisphaerales bacterium]
MSTDRTTDKAGQFTMQRLLAHMRSLGASDLHLKVGLPPTYRVNGRLGSPRGAQPLTAEDTERMLNEIIPPAKRQRFDTQGDIDFSTFQEYDEPISASESKDASGKDVDLNEQTRSFTKHRSDRFRCNVFRAGGAMHAAIRRVKPDIPTFESLNLPPIYRKLADETHEGLILVVGVTGSGKSTTLACMLERVNETRAENIVTIEDPVEYQIHPAKSVVSQREIGTDVSSYAEALKYVVRQDPDVIFIGELRDHDTVLAAIQAAETGHLVFGSLHTADTMQTFSRIVEFFPENEHAFVRSAMANSLKAVCAQRLLPALETAGVGTVPATEVLLATTLVKEKIREAEDDDIPTIIANSKSDGMHSFTDSLGDLIEREMVSITTAMEFAPHREALQSRLKGVSIRESGLVGRR